jgi:uncharacterized protein
MPAPTRPPTHLLYLHGFRSSPSSFKARLLRQWVQQHTPALTWWCPQLPPSPRAAWALMRDGTRDWPVHSMAVLGSSLGGFYATVAAEALGCAAVVLNPAVDPARDLAHYVGEQTAYHDPSQHFQFKAEYIDELRALTPPRITDPARYAAVIAKGDELLDWRAMSARYAGAHTLLLEGSDHALSDFALHMPFVLQFLRLRPHTV